MKRCWLPMMVVAEQIRGEKIQVRKKILTACVCVERVAMMVIIIIVIITFKVTATNTMIIIIIMIAGLCGESG